MAKQFVKGTSGSMGVIYSTSVQVALTNCDSRVLDNTWVILLKVSGEHENIEFRALHSDDLALFSFVSKTATQYKNHV